MSGDVRSVRGLELVIGGASLVLLGLLMMAFGAHTAALQICSPPSSACETSLWVRDLLDRSCSPGGVVLVVGIACAVIGMVLRLRARRSALA